jgi:phage tail-like protein
LKEERKKVFTNQFDTDLSADVTKISAITARFPKVPSSDGRNWQYKVYQPGQPIYGNITFEGAVHGDTFGNIKGWVKEVYDGNEIRKNIMINIRTQQQDGPARTFNLLSCFPTHFSCIDIGADGVAGSVQHWTLEVRVNRIEMG